MFNRTSLLFLLAILFFSSCVSQQKYKALLRARDNLELKATDYSVQLAQERTKALNLQSKNQDLNRQLLQASGSNQRTNRELDQLRKVESELNERHQDLTTKFEDMRDYFDIVLNECDKDKIAIARKERLLNQREDSMGLAIASLTNMERLLLDREQQAAALELVANNRALRLEAIFQDLNNSLSNLLSPQFSISKESEMVKISIDEPVIFVTGSIALTDFGSSALEQMALALNAQSNIQVTVVGHTDRNRIAKKSKYLSDNWDLSVLKAAAVTRALTVAKLDPTVVTAAGKSSNDPMVSNQTAEGREKNKRTEIIITPNHSNQSTPEDP